MAKLFECDGLKAQGEPNSLRTELNGNGRLQLSAMFKICDNETATDDTRRKVDVGGLRIAWYMTDSAAQDDASRDRLVRSLTAAGVEQDTAEEIVDAGRAGSVGDVPEDAGFGSRVSSLVVEIDEYNGKKRTRVKWVNDIDRKPKTREAGAPLRLKTLKNKKPGGTGSPPPSSDGAPPPWEQ